MPPKRRRQAETIEEPEQKKRVTRSSSKPSLPKQELAQADHRKPRSTPPTVASPQASNFRKKRTKTTTATSISSNIPKQQATESANGFTTLTITDPSIKNPITCDAYTRSSPGSSTTKLIFTHGAGGTLSASAVVNFCIGFSNLHPVLAFQGSMNLSARVKSFRALTSSTRADVKVEKLVLGGRSMGARAAVMACSKELATLKDVDVALLLVSYPLKGPKGDLRDEILLDLPAELKVLFVIGEKDAMCPLDALDEVRKKMAVRSRLIVVRGADHGMHVRPAIEEKRLGEEAGRLAAQWVNGEMKQEVVYIGNEG